MGDSLTSGEQFALRYGLGRLMRIALYDASVAERTFAGPNRALGNPSAFPETNEAYFTRSGGDIPKSTGEIKFPHVMHFARVIEKECYR